MSGKKGNGNSAGVKESRDPSRKIAADSLWNQQAGEEGEDRKSSRSVRRLIRNTFMILLAILAALLVILSLGNYRSLLEEMSDANIANLSDYASSFSMDLASLATSNKQVATDPYFNYLSLGLDASDKLAPEYHLRKILEYQTPYYGASLMYDSHDDACYYVTGSLFYAGESSVTEHAMMRGLCADLVGMDTRLIGHWLSYEYEGQPFLVFVSQNGSMYLASLLCLDIYLQNNPIPAGQKECGTFLFQDQDVILCSPASLSESLREDILPRLSGAEDTVTVSRQLAGAVTVEGTNLCIGIIVPLAALSGRILRQMLPFLFAGLFGIAAVLIAYGICKSVLVFPLQEISSISQRIDRKRQDERQNELQDTAKPEFMEYERIRSSLNGLIRQVQELESEKQAKEFEKEQALLQYYQLQTKSHFLLNCLKSLYGMADGDGNKEEIKAMIISISNHLRYVFHDSISLIRLKEEIQEIYDYRKTIQNSYRYPIIFFTDIPDEVMDCLVPPFILQTFIENAVKYSNKTPQESLAIRIRIVRIAYEGEDYLQIHVSDNGEGYDPNVLDKINSPLTGYFDEQNVGISNLKRRISIIFQGNYHSAFYNLPGGGACSIISIPLVRREEEGHEAAGC